MKLHIDVINNVDIQETEVLWQGLVIDETATWVAQQEKQ